MASTAHTTRRSLFAIAPAVAMMAAAPSVTLAAPQSPGDLFAHGVAAINPDLGPLARAALAAGWQPDELFAVVNGSNALPSLMFVRKAYEPDLKIKGWQKRTDLMATFQHDCPPATKTARFMVDPAGKVHG